MFGGLQALKEAARIKSVPDGWIPEGANPLAWPPTLQLVDDSESSLRPPGPSASGALFSPAMRPASPGRVCSPGLATPGSSPETDAAAPPAEAPAPAKPPPPGTLSPENSSSGRVGQGSAAQAGARPKSAGLRKDPGDSALVTGPPGPQKRKPEPVCLDDDDAEALPRGKECSGESSLRDELWRLSGAHAPAMAGEAVGKRRRQATEGGPAEAERPGSAAAGQTESGPVRFSTTLGALNEAQLQKVLKVLQFAKIGSRVKGAPGSLVTGGGPGPGAAGGGPGTGVAGGGPAPGAPGGAALASALSNQSSEQLMKLVKALVLKKCLALASKKAQAAQCAPQGQPASAVPTPADLVKAMLSRANQPQTQGPPPAPGQPPLGNRMSLELVMLLIKAKQDKARQAPPVPQTPQAPVGAAAASASSPRQTVLPAGIAGPLQLGALGALGAAAGQSSPLLNTVLQQYLAVSLKGLTATPSKDEKARVQELIEAANKDRAYAQPVEGLGPSGAGAALGGGVTAPAPETPLQAKEPALGQAEAEPASAVGRKQLTPPSCLLDSPAESPVHEEGGTLAQPQHELLAGSMDAGDVLDDCGLGALIPDFPSLEDLEGDFDLDSMRETLFGDVAKAIEWSDVWGE